VRRLSRRSPSSSTSASAPSAPTWAGSGTWPAAAAPIWPPGPQHPEWSDRRHGPEPVRRARVG